MTNEIISKQCSKCKETKPLSEFYKNRCRKDGYSSYCKICHIICVTNYYKTEKGKASQKRFNSQHPNRRKAKSAINNAIRDGRLPRPDTLQCHDCHAQAEQYHHPNGYKPKHWLDVIPVCYNCHLKYHNNNFNP